MCPNRVPLKGTIGLRDIWDIYIGWPDAMQATAAAPLMVQAVVGIRDVRSLSGFLSVYLEWF